MKRLKLLFAVWMLMLLSTPVFAQIQTIDIQWQGEIVPVIDRQMVLHLKASSEYELLSTFLEDKSLSIERQFKDLGIYVITIAEDDTLSVMLERFAQITHLFKSVEPNFINHGFHIPNDPLFSDQWHLRNNGTVSGSVVGADIKIKDAWDIGFGLGDVMVFILDSGISWVNGNLTHPERNDANRILIGDVYAMDFNNNPTIQDQHTHGTHISGHIGAATDNNVGIAGIASNVRMTIIRIMEPVALAFQDADFLAGVQDAVNYQQNNPNEQVIVHLSGGGPPSNMKIQAVQLTNANGIPMIVAAGNTNGNDVLFPAAYSTTNANVIAVSSTDHRDEISSFSAVGPEINLSAPGGFGGDFTDERNIFSTIPTYGTTVYPNQTNFGSLFGTSMAAPNVTGTAALMLSANPNLTPAQLRNRLEDTAGQVPGMGGQPLTDEYGHGRLNAFKAVSRALPHQFFNQFFAYSGSFSIGNSHIYGDSFFEYGTLNVPHGEVAVIDDTFYGYGPVWANMEVSGVLILSGSASINDMKIDVKNNGKLIVQPGAIISRVPIVIQNGGIADIRGGTFTLGSNEWFTSYGKAGINNASFTCASGSACNGVLFQGSGVSGSIPRHPLSSRRAPVVPSIGLSI